MKILIDTNIIVDVYQNREPFTLKSKAVLQLSERGRISGIITANQVTDIYYILGRHIRERAHLKLLVQKLLSTVMLADVTAADITAAFDLNMPDYEDALTAQCARRMKADYIITRNIKDFLESPVPVITPDDFMDKFFP